MTKKKIEINWGVIDTALQFMATKNQCVVMHKLNAGIALSEDTLELRIKEKFKKNFEDYRKDQVEYTKRRLIQKAIESGLEGNTALLIFCLKNICKWTDRPVADELEFSKLSLVELESIVNRAADYIKQKKELKMAA